MEKNNSVYISPNYTKEQYKSLGLIDYSNQETFEKAVEIFDDRIRGRFFEPINALRNHGGIDEYGFAVMALDCLLIEALAQFRRGLKNTKGGSRKMYKAFLICYFGVNEIMADVFYVRIRCGILHSAQTYENARLSTNNSFVIKLEGDVLLVSVDRFTARLIKYYNSYKSEILDENNVY